MKEKTTIKVNYFYCWKFTPRINHIDLGGGPDLLRLIIPFALMAAGSTAVATVQQPVESAEFTDEDPAPVAATCELHVWPGSDPIHIYYGWMHGGTVDGAIKPGVDSKALAKAETPVALGRPGYPHAPTDLLTAELQAALLEESTPQLLINRPEYVLVVHSEALSSRVIRTSSTRIAPSTSSCYAELIVDDVVLSQNAIGGPSLRTLFRIREFGSATTPTSKFTTWTMTRLVAFPRKPAEATAENMRQGREELKAAFIANLRQFAAATTKPAKAIKRRT